MTTPNGKHEFEAAIRLLRQYVDDATLAEKSCREDGFVDQADGYLAWIDDGTRALAALQDYPKLKAECEKWKAWYEERKDVAEGTRQMFNDKVAELEKVKAESLGNAHKWIEANVALEQVQVELARFAPLIEAARGVDKELAITTLRRLYHPMFQEKGRLVSVPIFDAIMPVLEAIPERDK